MTGGFGRYRHYSEPFTPDNTDIVTPNNDTPYSWGWFDLRAEPWVVTVPAIDRYYILPFHDLYTVYAGYVSAATTGTGRAATCSPDRLGRVHAGRDRGRHHGGDRLRRLPGSYRLRRRRRRRSCDDPAVLRRRAPVRAPAPRRPRRRWSGRRGTSGATDIGFSGYLDFLLQFAPVLDEDRDVRDRIAESG